MHYYRSILISMVLLSVHATAWGIDNGLPPLPVRSYSADTLAMAGANFTTPGDASAAVLNPSSMTANPHWMVMFGYAMGWYETLHFMEHERNYALMHIPQFYLTGPLCDDFWVGFSFAPEKTMRVQVGPQTNPSKPIGPAYYEGYDVFVLKPSLAYQLHDDVSVAGAFRYAYGRAYERGHYFLKATEEGVDYGWEVSATWNVSDSVRIAALHASALDTLAEPDVRQLPTRKIRQNTKIGCDWQASDEWLLGVVVEKQGDIWNARHLAAGIGAKYQVSETLRLMTGYTMEHNFARIGGRAFHTISTGVGKTLERGTDVSLGFAFNSPHHGYSSSNYICNFSLGQSF